ncbi:MAG: cytochrome c3 family protein [Anaerolineae bacterium]
MKKLLPMLVVGVLALAALALAGCAGAPQATPCPTPAPTVCPECPQPAPCPECPEPTPCPECPEAAVEVPFEALWAASAHADAEAEAFRHWDEATPPEVPVACAQCHSTPGYLDFLGADGSAVGSVEKAVPVGTTVECVACHNEKTVALSSVVFPSGAEVKDLGSEARCAICHQGRASGASVTASIEKAGLKDMDTPSADLGFTNIHYFAAAATLYGAQVKGGYEYEGKAYDAKFDHVPGFDTCVGCHDPHTLDLRLEACAQCHTGVKSREDLANIRMPGSGVDYDGDGDVKEGIAFEVQGLQEKLYQAIQAYAKEVAGTPIVYDAHTYPYFFVDTNGNGQVDEGEAKFDNKYNAWTGRLAKAAYNYQVSVKDPGAFAHGGKYIIQLLYDSVEDLNQALAQPVDLSKAHRIDAGHFAGSEEAFRHWDAQGVVPGTCSKCHTATGLPFFLKEGVTASQKPSAGLDCTACHDDLRAFTRYAVASVTFPSGAKLDSGNPDSNLCLQCHQGRESTVSVNALTAGLDEDATSEKLRFLNVHYFAAGATLFGTDAKGAYEYEGKAYVGRFGHVEPFSTCIQCHSVHGLKVQVEACGTCHQGVKEEADLLKIRMGKTDYDGDGDTTEGLAGEVETFREALYAALQAYAKGVAGTPIVYDAHAYPYFFTDTNGNGQADPEEAKPQNAYKAWTPRLLRAAYNYQYTTKDPGAFAHNGKYVIQVLYDSLESLGKKVSVDMAGMTRP